MHWEGDLVIANNHSPAIGTLVERQIRSPALVAGLPAGRVSDQLGGSVVAIVGMVIRHRRHHGGRRSTRQVVAPCLRGMHRLGQMLVMIGQQTFVANASVRTSSDSAFGTLTAAASIGQLIGPPLVNVAASLVVVGGQDEPNTAVGLAICTTMLVLGTPAYLALRRLDRSLGDARCSGDLPPPGTGALLKTPQMGRSLAVSGVVLVSLDLMYAFVLVWATERGINATAVGLLLALRAAVTVASRVGLARLVTRFERRTLITVSIGAAIAGLTALPLVGLWGGVLVMIALGIGSGVPQPLTMAWVTSLTPPQSHGASLGMRLTSNRLAQIVVPVAVGALAAPFGVLGIFWANAALLVGAAGIMVGSQPMDEGHSR